MSGIFIKYVGMLQFNLDIENTYMEDKSFQETLPLFILEIKIRQVYLFLVMGDASRKKKEE